MPEQPLHTEYLLGEQICELAWLWPGIRLMGLRFPPGQGGLAIRPCRPDDTGGVLEMTQEWGGAEALPGAPRV